MNPREWANRMRRWANQERSLAGYQERAGNMDARTALIGAALTVEMWADELDPPKKTKKDKS